MKKLPAQFLFAAVGALLLQPMMAQAASRYIWDANGFQSANNCVITSQPDIPFYVVQGTNAQSAQISDEEQEGQISNGSLVKVMGSDDNQRQKFVNVVSSSSEVKLEEGYMTTGSMKELSNFILQVKNSGKIAGHDLKDTFWQTTFSGDDYVSYLCKRGSDKRGYVAFKVFVAGQEEAIAEVGVSKSDTALFKSSIAHTVDEATKMIAQSSSNESSSHVATTNSSTSSSSHSSSAVVRPQVQSQGHAAVAPLPEVQHQVEAQSVIESQPQQTLARVVRTEEAPAQQVQVPAALKSIICIGSGNAQVRSENLKSVLFLAPKNQEVKLLGSFGQGPSTQIEGKKVSFIKVQVIGQRGQNTGWVSEEIVKTQAQCSAQVSVRPAPQTEPQPVVQDHPQSSAKFDPLAPSCARKKILVSAKKTVSNLFGNRGYSIGTCAYGVRRSLQASEVGDVNAGLGNAVDFLAQLKKRGFVDSGVKDPNKAPAGAVIILSGPKTQEYFRTGVMHRPYGTYVGHVTIKGDDGFYYTDGRTREVGTGWSGGRNRAGIRNVLAIMVPGEEVVSEFAGQCPGMAN